ncbi:MAG TPA: spore coat protein [Paenibacillus sp.]|uniref:spore coat protein n=1 Tax=Paenibacillus sp. TaxID=58172 RepID=UPI002CFA43D8|nr:spore coat protein [Paenibacillus sp.]HUC90504.1 spore coat protein [Paenibacillus sp.]
MNNDYLDPINAENMPDMADMTFAMDLLMRAKNGVRNCAYALAETATPEVKAMLTNQLNQAIAMHAEIAKLMIDKHWLHPYHVSEQSVLDMKSADTTVKIANMKLYPDHTSRLGMFATPGGTMR